MPTLCSPARLPTPPACRTLPADARAHRAGWLALAFEVKHDGYRFIARRDGDRVRVFSRNARDWTDRVPLIVEAMRALAVTSATLDGEGVVVDERGLTDLERLRAALAERGGSRAAFLYAFDLLELNGTDLRPQPWIGRRLKASSASGLIGRIAPGGVPIG